MACQLATHPGKVQDFRNAPDLMITGNGLLEVEAIEQLPLVPIEPPHHRPISQKAASPRPNHDSAAASKRLLQQNRPTAAVLVTQGDGRSTPTNGHPRGNAGLPSWAMCGRLRQGISSR